MLTLFVKPHVAVAQLVEDHRAEDGLYGRLRNLGKADVEAFSQSHVGPVGALIIGAAGGYFCYQGVTLLKSRFKIDDSLDVFAVHGIGGMLGTLLIPFVGVTALGGAGFAEGVTVGGLFGVQLMAVVAVAVWSAVFSWILIKIVAATVGLRVSADDETEGLDITAHGESGYHF